jgi:MFS transporter, NNP family, nitrate/nitrite transporter
MASSWIANWNPKDNKVLESLALKVRSKRAAALGLIGAISTCGGYLIPRGFGASVAATGRPHFALEVYLAFYVTCIAPRWWYYLRKSSMTAGAPSLAEARV